MQYLFVLSAESASYSLDVSSRNHTDDRDSRTFPQVRSVTLIGHQEKALFEAQDGAGGSFKYMILVGKVGLNMVRCTDEERTQKPPVEPAPHYLYISTATNIFKNNSADAIREKHDNTCTFEPQLLLKPYEEIINDFRVTHTFDETTKQGIADKAEYEANYEAGLFKDLPLDHTLADALNLNRSTFDPRITNEAAESQDAYLKTLGADEKGDEEWTDGDGNKFFEEVSYIGAFGPGYGADNNWIEGWTWLSDAGILDMNAFKAKASGPLRAATFAFAFVLAVLVTS
jgi:hypothetical protein